MTRFDPTAFNAGMEQFESAMRDTFIASSVRMYVAAQRAGAPDTLANEIAGQWLAYLLTWLPIGAGK